MKKSLGKKICVIGIGLIVGFVLLNIILTYFLLVPFSTYLSTKQMEKLAIQIEEEQLYAEDSFAEYMTEVEEDTSIQITLIDKKKKVILSEQDNIKEKNKINKSLKRLFNRNKEKLEAGECISITLDKAVRKRIRIILIKKVGDNRYVILSRSYRSLQNVTRFSIMFNVISGIVMILLGFILVYRISRYLIIPICEMRDAAEDIANLQFGTKIETNTQDELGQLGMSINKMSEHLEENLMQLQEDIDSRKRLVRNLSHEIKSPIAVIMGYSERMKKVMKDNPEKALQYCEIISNESVRVDVIMKEMLELSKMEQGLEVLNKEEFQVDILFRNMKKRFHEEYMEKKIQYTEEYDCNETVVADFLMLERAVYNLIHNAVDHSTTEQMLIRASGERKEEFYEFKVYNSGSHIDENEISSIWEAFSKVDKVRTRGKQGHGVGLAIVKEIIDAHKGYYSVRNVEGGVEFQIAIKG